MTGLRRKTRPGSGRPPRRPGGRVSARPKRPASARPDREGGQVALLVLGFTVVTLLLVIGGVDVTAVQLARTRMMDAADGAALDAADSIDLASTYGAGLQAAVPLSDATVVSAAAGYLARQPTPEGVSRWGLAAGTGSPDGRTAVVRLRGTARLPLADPLLRAFGGAVELNVESRARAVVQ